MELTTLEKVCIGAKLICDVCGKTRLLDPDRVGAYVLHGWPPHCGQTMRLVTKAGQMKEGGGMSDNKPRFLGGEAVMVISRVSRNRGKMGTILGYCHGRYKTICRVKLETGKIVNFFDTSLAEAQP